MIESAREYLRRGLSVIPVCSPTPSSCSVPWHDGHPDDPHRRGKIPAVKWEAYQLEPPHPDQVDEWWTNAERNVGIVTGAVSGLVVLDADGPTGIRSLDELQVPRETWIQRTGREDGGLQIFLRHPGGGVMLSNRAGIRPGLDVRGDGGYVVAPASLHQSGRRYEWLTSPDASELAALPASLLALLTTPIADSSLPTADAIPEGQRNDRLYRLTRSLIRRGLTPGAVHVAIAEENRTRCRPPLPDREVRQLVEHALLQPNRHDFDTEPTVGAETVIPLGVGLGSFLAQTFPPVTPYIEGLLSSDGGGFAGGEEKLGKTLYCEHEAICLATGQPVCGRFTVPARQRVLYIQEEDSPRRTRARFAALLRGLGFGFDPDEPDTRADLEQWFHLEVWAGFSFDNPAMVARLDAALATFKPAVCYLDVLRKLTAADLNKAVEVAPVLATLDGLRRRHGTVFRVLHHYRKIQGGFRAGRGSQEIAGAFALGAWAEQSLFFEPTSRKPGAPVIVTVQSKDAAPVPGFTLKIESEGPRHDPTLYRLIAEDQKPATDEVDEIVYQAIVSLPKTEALAGKPGVLLTAIIQAVRKSEKTVRRALDRLQDAGRILVTGNATKRAALYGVRE